MYIRFVLLLIVIHNQAFYFISPVTSESDQICQDKIDFKAMYNTKNIINPFILYTFLNFTPLKYYKRLKVPEEQYNAKNIITRYKE